MTAQFSGEEIIDITKGRAAAGSALDEVGEISTDTRALRPGDWYVALKGEKFDGHDFLGDAVAAGAAGAIVEQRAGYPVGDPSFCLIAVEDTVAACQLLARNWRKRINPFVVGVTGSSGKTTTKEMCAAVFSSALRCHKSRENENNDVGVAKTILSMADDTQVLIVEMAMRGSGQIRKLARCALPDVGIITNAGVAHLELLGSLENIAKAKCELLSELPANRGVGIIGSPTPRLLEATRQVFSGKLLCCDPDVIVVKSVSSDTTSFQVRGMNDIFTVQAHGQPLLEDAWCAVTAGQIRGLSGMQIASGLSAFKTVAGRGNRLIGPDGALVLDETYNANPDSVRASVAALLDERVYPHHQKIVVLGELAELGPSAADLHRELGHWLKEKPLSVLLTVGRLARHIAEGAQGAHYEVIACMDQTEAAALLRTRLGAQSCVLVKGSHCANLDRLVASLVDSR